MAGSQVVAIRPPTEEARRIWRLVLSLAEDFGADREWSLIGGLMVQLHGFEHDDDLRPTADIDLLGGARRAPRMTEEMADLLVRRGAVVATPPRSNPELGYRFGFEGETIELLGPDGLRRDPKTVAGLRTFQAAGGTQALRRTRIVLVVLDDRKPVAVRCPDLLGAILIKARVALKMRKRKYLSDRQDLIRLLSYVDDPRALAAEATRSERSWLREVEATVDFDNATLVELFPDERLVRARQALKLLGQAGFPALSEM